MADRITLKTPQKLRARLASRTVPSAEQRDGAAAPGGAPATKQTAAPQHTAQQTGAENPAHRPAPAATTTIAPGTVPNPAAAAPEKPRVAAPTVVSPTVTGLKVPPRPAANPTPTPVSADPAQTAPPPAAPIGAQAPGPAQNTTREPDQPGEDADLLVMLQELNAALDTMHSALADSTTPHPAEGVPAPVPPAAVLGTEQPNVIPPRANQPKPAGGHWMALGVAGAFVTLAGGLGAFVYAEPELARQAVAKLSVMSVSSAPANTAERRLAPAFATAVPTGESKADTGSSDLVASSGVSDAPARQVEPNDAQPAFRTAALVEPGLDATPRPDAQETPGTAPTFTVAPARGNAWQPIALSLALPPGMAAADVSVMLLGLPVGSQLSAGKALDDDGWLVDGTELDGLTLTVPRSYTNAAFELDVMLVTSDGRAPQMRKMLVSLEPAEPPEAGAAPALPAREAEHHPIIEPETPDLQPLSVEEEKDLLARGESLMTHGDVASARLVLEHAARRGSTRAMLALGKSYDPDELKSLGVQGMRPDIAQAASWYERASKGGNQESRVRAEALFARARR